MAGKKEKGVIHVRVDSLTKSKAEEIFKQLGITTTEAITIFLNQVVIQKSIPFPLTTEEDVNKMKAEEIFSQLGLSSTDAMSLFLSQVAIKKGIPFPLTVEESKKEDRK